MSRKESLSAFGKNVIAAVIAVPAMITGGALALVYKDIWVLENYPHTLSNYGTAPEKHGPLICAATGAELNAQFKRAGIPETLAITTGDEMEYAGKGFCKLELRKDYNSAFYDPDTAFQPEARANIVNFIVRGLNDESLLRLRATLEKNPGPAP